jgi:hypothetical protein
MESAGKIIAGDALASFNRCRIYLQAVWWSEITTGNGKKLDWFGLNRSRNPTKYKEWKWPIQPNPNKRDWECWDAVLKN